MKSINKISEIDLDEINIIVGYILKIFVKGYAQRIQHKEGKFPTYILTKIYKLIEKEQW